jgi:hypothetical protein
MSVERAHAFTRYENAVSGEGAHSKMLPFFARWILDQRSEDDPVERFDAWLMIIPTDPRLVAAEGTLDERVGLTTLPPPLGEALPVIGFQARGVWAPERALDGKIVPEGGYGNPVSANMSAGCPNLTIDLGQPRRVRSAFLQADSVDQLLLEGSLDGATFSPLGEMRRLKARLHRSRVVALPGEAVRFVRIRPAYSRALRHSLSEVALYDREVSLPELPSRKEAEFVTSIAQPSIVGIVSGSNHPDPGCPAESPSLP